MPGLADVFKKARPWEMFENEDLFRISFSEEDFAYVIVLGAGAEVYGFSLYPGDSGYNDICGLFTANERNIPEEYIMLQQNCITMNLANRDEIDERQHELIQNLGLRFRGKNNWIYFDRYETGYCPYILTREEVLFTTRYLEKLIDAIRECQWNRHRENWEQNQLFAYTLKDGQWSGELCEKEEQIYHWDSYELKNEVLKARLGKYRKKKKAGTFYMDLFYMTSMVDDPEYKKPFFPMAGFVVDEETEMILDQCMIGPGDDKEDFTQMLVEIILEEEPPKKIIVRNEMIKDQLSAVTDAAGIKLEIGDMTVMDEFQEELFSGIGDMSFMDEFQEELLDEIGGMADMDLSFLDPSVKFDKLSSEEKEMFLEKMIDLMEAMGLDRDMIMKELKGKRR